MELISLAPCGCLLGGHRGNIVLGIIGDIGPVARPLTGEARILNPTPAQDLQVYSPGLARTASRRALVRPAAPLTVCSLNPRLAIWSSCYGKPQRTRFPLTTTWCFGGAYTSEGR